MNSRIKVSDSEINGCMDFDGLLKKRNAIVARRNNLLKWSVISGVVLLIGVIAYLTIIPTHPEKNVPVSKIRGSVPADSLSMASAPMDTAIAREDSNMENSIPEKKSPAKTKVVTKSNSDEKATIPPVDNIYIQAEPIEGYNALYSYLNATIIYPEQARADSLRGVVTVTFVIDIYGDVSDVQATSSLLGDVFKAEAVRVVSQMSKWKPATLNGKPIKSKISLPITFEIQSLKK